MPNIHHKPIRQFTLNGIIHDDAAIPRLRIEYIRLMTLNMREDGFVPRLDIDPDFTIQYNNNKEYFEFTLSVYGTYIGKRKSKCTVGIDGTVAYTQQSKSSVSSQDQESQLNRK